MSVTSVRESQATKEKWNWLAEHRYDSKAQAHAVAIDRLYQEEKKQMENERKFYPIWLEYVGPNDVVGHLKTRIRIRKMPGTKNMSGEPCVDGWLGTTDDWSKTALGELDAAEMRALLVKEGVQVPSNSKIAYDDYSVGDKNSEWYNKQFVY